MWFKSRIPLNYQLSYTRSFCKVKNHTDCLTWLLHLLKTSLFGCYLQTGLVFDSLIKVRDSESDTVYWFTTARASLSRKDCHWVALNPWPHIYDVSGNFNVYCCLYLSGRNCDRLWDWYERPSSVPFNRDPSGGYKTVCSADEAKYPKSKVKVKLICP